MAIEEVKGLNNGYEVSLGAKSGRRFGQFQRGKLSCVQSRRALYAARHGGS